MHSQSHGSGLHRLRAWVRGEVATLHPGCCALVMATGIISNGLFLCDRREWSDLMFCVMAIAWPGLILLTLCVCCRFRARCGPT